MFPAGWEQSLYKFCFIWVEQLTAYMNDPVLAPCIDDVILGRPAFQISFSKKDTAINALNYHWGSVVVDTGILSNIIN